MPYGKKSAVPVPLTATCTPWGVNETVQYYPGKNYSRYGTNTRKPTGTSGGLRAYTYVIVSRLSRRRYPTGRKIYSFTRKKWIPEKIRVPELRLKKVYLKSPGTGRLQTYRGSNPNVLTFRQATRSEVPTDQVVSGMHAFQPWSVTCSPLNSIAPKGYTIGTNVANWLGTEDGWTNHPSAQQTVAMLRESATNKLHKKLKEQDFNAAVTLGQYAETAATLSDIAVKTAKVVASVRRGNLRGAKKVFSELFGGKKQVASTHLQYTYGIAPLLSDIDSAARALAELPGHSSFFTVKAKEKATLPVYENVIEDNEFCTTVIRMTGTVEFKLSARMQVDNLFSRNLAEVGLHSYAPLEVGWELIPFSFVVDWFYPIGNYLSSLSSHVGLTADYVTETIVIKHKVTVFRELKTRAYNQPLDGGAFVVTSGFGSAGAQVDCVHVTRAFSSIAPPTPPVLKNPLSGAHLLNAAALITQLFSKGK